MKDKVLKLIAEQFNIDVSNLNMDLSFKDDLNADSIELVQLVMLVEDEFDVSVDDDKISQIKTVGDVIDYLEQNLDM